MGAERFALVNDINQRHHSSEHYLQVNLKLPNMKTLLITFSAMILLTQDLVAQTTEDSVKAVVKQSLDGMKNADVQMLVSAFADSAILQSVGRNEVGKTVIERHTVDEFAKLVAGLKKGAADEQIVIESIKIDGALAMVWASYRFYYEGKFSHCGADSYQLVFLDGHWKIQYVIDTRRQQPCN